MSYVETLGGVDVEFGKRVWKALQERNFPFSGIFWLLESSASPPLPDTGEWRLVIATPKVDTLGPRDAYRELSEVTLDLAADSRQLLSIELISPNHPIYKALRSVFGEAASVEGARLGNTQVAGLFMDGAYLYQIR